MEKIEPGSPEEARAAFVAVAAEIAQLRKLSLANLEQKHLELLGVASAVRSRDALIKRISLALQRKRLERMAEEHIIEPPVSSSTEAAGLAAASPAGTKGKSDV